MREIKFRVRYKNSWCIIELNKGLTDFGYEAYMECVKNGEKFYQYTGLKDKNGKEIYEGDILKVNSNYMEKPEIYKVKWFGEDYPAFDLENWESESNGLSELSQSGEYDYKVIGNIFENPELINK